jgi:hypothetical protein
VNRPPSPDEGYQLAARILGVTVIGFGLLMLVLGLASAGPSAGVPLGLLFVALGSGRLYLSRRG